MGCGINCAGWETDPHWIFKTHVGSNFLVWWVKPVKTHPTWVWDREHIPVVHYRFSTRWVRWWYSFLSTIRVSQPAIFRCRTQNRRKSHLIPLHFSIFRNLWVIVLKNHGWERNLVAFLSVLGVTAKNRGLWYAGRRENWVSPSYSAGRKTVIGQGPVKKSRPRNFAVTWLHHIPLWEKQFKLASFKFSLPWELSIWKITARNAGPAPVRAREVCYFGPDLERQILQDLKCRHESTQSQLLSYLEHVGDNPENVCGI